MVAAGLGAAAGFAGAAAGLAGVVVVFAGVAGLAGVVVLVGVVCAPAVRDASTITAATYLFKVVPP